MESLTHKLLWNEDYIYYSRINQGYVSQARGDYSEEEAGERERELVERMKEKEGERLGGGGGGQL